ncbi:Hypothetical protein FKW44_011125, partial [Caligus rogercresseyi]
DSQKKIIYSHLEGHPSPITSMIGVLSFLRLRIRLNLGNATHLLKVSCHWTGRNKSLLYSPTCRPQLPLHRVGAFDG